MNRSIKNIIITGIISLIVVISCKHRVNNTEQAIRSNIPVTVSSVRTSDMINYTELSATSSFLVKATIKAPVTGYVDNMNINPGDAIEKNQLLFTIKTKEASAIMTDSLNNLNFRGIVDVKAEIAGLVSTIEHTKGDFVTEGDELCQIAVPESVVFILDVPVESAGSIRLNMQCEIMFPDNQVIKGIIKSRLPAMTSSSQTERFIVRLSKPERLPENLVCKIRILKEYVKNAISLPKTSILTDETMQSFWVMKLINDSVAVKVPVTIGIRGEEYVQIIHPVFNASDLFLTSGNYGLGDSAFIKIIKPASHE
jgi:biotin carboxyl carrier protein